MAGGCVSFAVQLAGHIAAVVFHSNSAAGHGQRVAARSIGIKLPTGIEGDVLRNCGFVHIKGLAIFGVPAGELVTRTGGIMDGSQFVCLGISDFFGLINRHLSGVGQGAALGIKGHIAEVKKLVSFQYSIAWVFKQSFCGVHVVVVVEDTSSRTFFQTVSERSKSSRERNGFQIGAICKDMASHRLYRTLDGKRMHAATCKGKIADGSDALWNGDTRQMIASKKGIIADRLNTFT